MSQSQENLWADRRRDRQTVFYRTLLAKTRGTTTSLQQVTAGNTPNLVLKRMLRYFQKIPPLKKILQFFKTKIRQKRKFTQKRKLQTRNLTND